MNSGASTLSVEGLQVNQVPFRHVLSFDEALRSVPPGRLEVIANYTAFQDIRAELDRVN